MCKMSNASSPNFKLKTFDTQNISDPKFEVIIVLFFLTKFFCKVNFIFNFQFNWHHQNDPKFNVIIVIFFTKYFCKVNFIFTFQFKWHHQNASAQSVNFYFIIVKQSSLYVIWYKRYIFRIMIMLYFRFSLT
jgi:hypothetical protein